MRPRGLYHPNAQSHQAGTSPGASYAVQDVYFTHWRNSTPTMGGGTSATYEIRSRSDGGSGDATANQVLRTHFQRGSSVGGTVQMVIPGIIVGRRREEWKEQTNTLASTNPRLVK